MQELQSTLRDGLLIAEFLSALVGIIYLFKLKKSYWKWFSIYLVVIFIQEYFWITGNSIYFMSNVEYYVFFGIPFQYIFLYWLYALKSLKKRNLFLLCSVVYIVTIGLAIGFVELSKVLTFSINIGTIILTVLVVLEFIKQIKNDDILRFRENKMFYINTGMILFYIGTYPYLVFGNELYTNYRGIYDIYDIYFLIANYIMYLLFAASFIWGKAES